MKKSTIIEAPCYKIDGVPAYRAGEWEGHKSNKFERTRLCIHSNDMPELLQGCDFFNQNPRKRHFTIPPGKEEEFKPCVKIFQRAYYTSKELDVKESDIKPTPKSDLMITLEPKKHYFNYKDKYTQGLLKKYADREKKVFVKDELQYLSKIGMLHEKEEFAQKISEARGEELNDNKEKKHSKPKKALSQHDYLNKRREMALLEMKIRMENIKKDIDYIKDLNEWDKTYLKDLNEESF